METANPAVERDWAEAASPSPQRYNPEKPMSSKIAVLLAILCLSSEVAIAQSETAERNATAQEITGNWQLLPLPEALEPKILKTNPWPASCQWYSYSSNGTLKSIDKTSAPCDSLTAAQLDQAVIPVPAVASWKYDLSPAIQKALVIITRSDVKGYAEYWEPHFVTKPFSNGGVEFQTGDLIFYLVNLQSHQTVWIRHLRKLN